MVDGTGLCWLGRAKASKDIVFGAKLAASGGALGFMVQDWSVPKLEDSGWF